LLTDISNAGAALKLIHFHSSGNAIAGIQQIN